MLELRPVTMIRAGYILMTIKVNNLDQKQSVFSQFMAEIRDADIQQDSMR
jgi:hypothetical protein